LEEALFLLSCTTTRRPSKGFILDHSFRSSARLKLGFYAEEEEEAYLIISSSSSIVIPRFDFFFFFRLWYLKGEEAILL